MLVVEVPPTLEEELAVVEMVDHPENPTAAGRIPDPELEARVALAVASHLVTIMEAEIIQGMVKMTRRRKTGSRPSIKKVVVTRLRRALVDLVVDLEKEMAKIRRRTRCPITCLNCTRP